MLKINNRDMKVAIIICSLMLTVTFITCITVFFIFKQWIIGSCLIPIGLIVFFINIKGKWPESIAIDDEKIVVFRLGKEINRISWQNVTEIYKKEIPAWYRFNCYYYFSDGQDSEMTDKEGNEHFIVFRSPKNKEYLFSKFTKLPIKELDKEK